MTDGLNRENFEVFENPKELEKKFPEFTGLNDFPMYDPVEKPDNRPEIQGIIPLDEGYPEYRHVDHVKSGFSGMSAEKYMEAKRLSRGPEAGGLKPLRNVTVPLTAYDADGKRRVVGTARVGIRDGCLFVTARVDEEGVSEDTIASVSLEFKTPEGT